MINERIKVGISWTEEKTVRYEDTAEFLDSGALPIFATPNLILLVEKTAWTSVEPLMNPGESTVGHILYTEHIAPTVVGQQVVCKTCLTEIDGRRLKFEYEVKCGEKVIGKGTHERVVISKEQFMEKAEKQQ